MPLAQTLCMCCPWVQVAVQLICSEDSMWGAEGNCISDDLLLCDAWALVLQERPGAIPVAERIEGVRWCR
jgi:hypothetical protein